MLAIFRQEYAHPPEELNSPASKDRRPKQPDQIVAEFLSSDPHNAFTMYGDGAVLAYIRSSSRLPYSRLFCGLDDVYCVFLGTLDNLSALIRQYGLSKNTDEALLVIEAYRTLRDRGPYPADQVVKDLVGHFAFVIFDRKSGTVFAALGSDGVVQLYWGIAADGSVVISDNVDVVRRSCGKSFAPFPAGCMFHSGTGGLQSFEHPMNKLKAMPRVDSEGVLCGANFKVDTYTKVNSMPRVGSSANWAPLSQ
ncbi:Stem-specific protein [Nymphaea thermarum]|nr:stem-specific protein TSJT1 [Nymphaea colorata]KAF3778506.1 Stem-specific protein [Nymphaea thermarum]